MKIKFLLCLSMMVSTLSPLAIALQVDPISLRASAQALQNKALLVKNMSEKDEYVQISIKKYINVGTDEEGLIDVDSQEFDVYPKQFINTPNRQRRVFILYGGEKIEKEQVYQVLIEDVGKEQANEGSMMFAKIRYAVNVFLTPETPSYAYNIQQDASSSKAYIHNTGNVRIHVEESGCKALDKTNGFIKYRIYPDQKKQIELCDKGKLVINNEYGKVLPLAE